MKKYYIAAAGIIIAIIVIACSGFWIPKRTKARSALSIATATTTTTITTTTLSTIAIASSSDPMKKTYPQAPQGPSMTIQGKEFKTLIADTPELQEQGLSDRMSLPQDTVMLFKFEYAWPWGIWMKDMNFPLDIFWLDQSMKVIFMEQNVSPDSYPQTFTPSQSAWYVVEANAGIAAENAIATGTVFSLSSEN